MAEGVCIERQTNRPDAMRAAADIAARGARGEIPVLVYPSPPSPPRDEVVEALRELTKAFVNEFGSGEYEPDDSSVYVGHPDGEGITFGMLRRARRALSSIGMGGENNV
jgi:hypothetical protein